MTIFSATQCYNIIVTLFQKAATLFQHLNLVLTKNCCGKMSFVTSPVVLNFLKNN